MSNLFSEMENRIVATLNAMPGLLTLFGSGCALYAAIFGFPIWWFLSGTPFLTALLLLGSANGRPILSIIPMAINLVYAVCATSWLLYWVYAAACYPAMGVVGMYQLSAVSGFTRRVLRKLLREFQFTADKIALFNIPALEIDTEVDGLMVIRGLTISLSSLTVVASGIEVGIKLSEDLEMAIQTNTVTIKLFRSIEVDDVYANLKGGEYEMTFGKLPSHSDDGVSDAFMSTDTPLLQAAAANGHTRDKAKDDLTNGANASSPKSTSAKSGAQGIKTLSADEERANGQYSEAMAEIGRTSAINRCELKVKRRITAISSDTKTQGGFDYRSQNDMRAAICSELHDTPSVPNPPSRSVKVTTLQNVSPPWVRRFLHRLPLLLRVLLYPLSYMHSIRIASITAAGSGKWIQYMLDQHVFQQYGNADAELRRITTRVSNWLSDANFAVEIGSIHAVSQVPINPAYPIEAQIKLDDVMAYRTLPKEIDLKQVLRLRGAGAEVSLPSFLLPHHEHLLPPRPTAEDEAERQRDLDRTKSRVHEVVAEHALDQTRKDETNIKMSARIRLPAVFDQELLDWIAALVKVTKLIEWEKEPAPLEEYKEKEKHGLKELTKALHISMKDGMKRAAVDVVTNDRWIAKLVGKATKKLETAQGDVGYSGDVPVALKPYRDAAEDAIKLLP